MTPQPPPGFELVQAQQSAPPAPPPGFEIVGDEADAEASAPRQQAEVRSYEPTWRDQIGSYLSDLMGHSPEADRLVSGVVGSTGLGHSRMSVSDFTPARIPLYAQEAKRAYDDGNMGTAALNALSATPVPVVSQGIDAIATAAKPVMAATGRAVTAAQARLPRVLTGKGADDVADAVIAGRLQRSGQSADTVAEDLAGGQRSARLESNSRATLPETIADTSQDMQRLTGSAYRTGGEAGEIIKPALEARQKGPANFFAERVDDAPQGQIERIVDDFDRALGVKSSKGARATSTELEAAQKSKADDLYTKARDASEPFEIEGVATAWHLRAQQYQGDFRKKLTAAIDLFTQPAGLFTRFGANNVTRFDNAKKVLDDIIENSKGEFGKATNLTRELANLKKDLLSEVHKGGKNKFYQQARDEFGTAAENREAIDLGRKAMREDSEVSVEVFKSLTPAQQKLFRIGMRDAVRLTLATKKPGDNATLPFQQRRVRELLDEVIPTPRGKKTEFSDRAERFGDIMRREERMSETRNRVLGNSATAERVADDAEFASDALSRALTGGRSLANMGLEIVGSGLQKAFGYRRDVAASLARKLMDTNPATRAETLQAIRAQQSPQAFSEFAEGVHRAFPRTVPPLTPTQTDRPEPRQDFPEPMHLGGPKPNEASPSGPDDPRWIPGTEENKTYWDGVEQTETKAGNDRALLRYGDQVVVPSLPEIGQSALDAVSNAGEAAMAFGPMGEALQAPMAGLGALVKSIRGKPGAVTPLTAEREAELAAAAGQRARDTVQAASSARYTSESANAARASGSTGTVPATANTNAVIDAIEGQRAGRNIPGRQGARSVDEQTELIRSAPPPPIVQGPWGANMQATIRGALERAAEVRQRAEAAKPTRGPSRGVIGEAVDRPGTTEIIKAFKDLKVEADTLRDGLSSRQARVEARFDTDREMKAYLREQLKKAQEELVRLQKAMNGSDLPPPEPSQMRTPRIFKRGEE